MKIVSIVGARPQFVKAALVSVEVRRRGLREILVHTGQHYDHEMSQIFFDQLTLPAPAFSLGVGSGTHASQTAEMMNRLEPVIAGERPDWVLIYGDTNTTLAGALVASKLSVPLAHVEAGLRSFNKAMPEEINRIVADHVSDILLVPHRRAASQLSSEGITKGVHIVGDLMVDSVMRLVQNGCDGTQLLDRFGVTSKKYAVATIHRTANTDDRGSFSRIIRGLRQIPMRVVFPIHPRSASLAKHESVGQQGDNIIASKPLGYADMITLQRHARVILTDSGGMQKEALVLRVPCVTLRNETEWVETLENGWNVLAGTDPDTISLLAQRREPTNPPKNHYGDGTTAAHIVDALQDSIQELGHSVERDLSSVYK